MRNSTRSILTVLALGCLATALMAQHPATRTGEPRPVCVEHSGLFRLTAKPFCEGLELAIETNPAIAGQIASLLAKL